MSIRLSLPEFLKTAADTYASSQQGLQDGQQQQQQQQRQQFLDALNVAQVTQGEQDRQYSALAKLPLTDQSQADLTQGYVNQPNAYAGLGGLPYAQHTPGLAGIFPKAPAPAAAPSVPPGTLPTVTPGAGVVAGAPTAPAAGGQPTITSPKFGKLTLRGVDPKQAAALMADLKTTSGQLQNIDFGDDVKSKSAVEAMLGQIPAEIKTPEDLQQARATLTAMKQAQVGLGPRAAANRRIAAKDEETQLRNDTTLYEGDVVKHLSTMDDQALVGSLPGLLEQERSLRERRGTRGYGGYLESSANDIAEMQQKAAAGDQDGALEMARTIRGRINARVDPKMESEKQRNVLARIGRLDPSQVTPDVVRQTYEKAGIGYLVDGLPDEALMYGGSSMRKELNRSIADLSRFKDMNPAAQKVALDHVAYAAQYSDEPITIPSEIVSQMTDAQRQRLAFVGDRVRIAQQNADTADRRADIAADSASARQKLAQAKFDWLKANPPASRAGGKGGLTQNAKSLGLYREWQEAQKDYDSLFGGGKGKLYDNKTEFDPTGTYQQGSDEYKAQQLYQKAQQKAQVYHDYVVGGGADAERQQQLQQQKSAPATGTTQAQPAPTGFQPPSGVTPQQYRQNIYQRGRARGWSEKKINTFLRLKGAM